ncbi:MAG TPA: deoxyhypusine synthase family protein [Thermoanaerobaculia bacterium]
MSTVRDFMERYFRHFNAAETLAAARAYRDFIDSGGAMVVAIAGAMSTAEVGVVLARMIRERTIHAICSTAANIEEDFYSILARRDYRTGIRWRTWTATDDYDLREAGFNRVTDTAIPESVIESATAILRPLWRAAAHRGLARFPYEWFYETVLSVVSRGEFHIPPQESWLLAAAEQNLPLFCPGFEDSSTASMMVADMIAGRLSAHVARSGTEELQRFAEWMLRQQRARRPAGLLQIGGGIAGDFAISVVPLLLQDAVVSETFWQLFIQVSDSTTSYGSYSGAPPAEKITWWKLEPKTPAFMIESDATLVVPLLGAYVLDE